MPLPRPIDIPSWPDDFEADPLCPWCDQPCGDLHCTCDLDGMGAHPGLVRSHKIRRLPGKGRPRFEADVPAPSELIEARHCFRPRRYNASFTTGGKK